MFEIQQGSESIFRNNIRLNLIDSEIEKSYQMIKYSNKFYLLTNLLYFFQFLDQCSSLY